MESHIVGSFSTHSKAAYLCESYKGKKQYWYATAGVISPFSEPLTLPFDTKIEAHAALLKNPERKPIEGLFVMDYPSVRSTP